jgi:glutathione-specific gamma-glutamylcyclotransferase
VKRFDGLFPRLEPRVAALALLRARYQLMQRGELWVFAYGSLLWRPCYRPDQIRAACVSGFSRRLCVWTVEARGTPAHPGLGLGLEARAGARCSGAVQRIPRAQWLASMRALWAREMWTAVYVPRWVRVTTPFGLVSALTFVVDRANPQFAGELGEAAAAAYIAAAHGKLGSCIDYVMATEKALNQVGIRDPHLRAVAAALRTAA